MAISTVVAATNTRLTTLAAAKTKLKLSSSTSTSVEDAILIIVDRASDAVRAHTERLFETATYQESIPGNGDQYLSLQHTPIVGITSVLHRGTVITDYVIEDAEGGLLYREGGWEWSVAANPESLSPAPIPGASLNDYVITYRAGYNLPGDTSTSTGNVINLPGPVEQATLETLKSWYRNTGRVGDVRSRKTGNLSRQFDLDAAIGQSKAGLPPSAETLLIKWEGIGGYS